LIKSSSEIDTTIAKPAITTAISADDTVIDKGAICSIIPRKLLNSIAMPTTKTEIKKDIIQSLEVIIFIIPNLLSNTENFVSL
jgi:hypothetical protein